MSASKRFAEIKGRLNRITPGHWVAAIDIKPIDGRYWDASDVYAVDELPVPDYNAEGTEDDAARVSAWADEHCRGTLAETHNYFSIPDEQHDANQRLIAHAPDDLRFLLAEVARLTGAIEEHHRDFTAIDTLLNGSLGCGGTKDDRWTIKQLRKIVRPT